MHRSVSSAIAAGSFFLPTLLALTLGTGPVRAGIVLSVVEPERMGVGASAFFPQSFDGVHHFAPDSAPQTIAGVSIDSGTSEATLNDAVGPVRMFTFSVMGYNTHASTASPGVPGGFQFRIDGTEGESGPVVVEASSVFTRVSGSVGSAHVLNGTVIPVPAGPSEPSLYPFRVGDTFTYRADLSTNMAGAGTLETILRVRPDGSPKPIPEPATLALLTLPALCLARKRRQPGN